MAAVAETPLQGYSCQACSVVFRQAEMQKQHWRSDWHRYNLKRKISQMPPVSAQVFAEKVLAAQQEEQDQEERDQYVRSCDVCQKEFSSANAYNNHAVSKKHVQAVRAHEARLRGQRRPAEPVAKTVSESETSTETSSNELDEKDCLFCPERSADSGENVLHMYRVHNLSIPEQEYVSDLSGLLKYLAAKVSVGFTCIQCNKHARSLQGVRQHISQKSHYRIAYDTEEEMLELGDFYDFRSSYPDYVSGEDDGEEAEAVVVHASDIDSEDMDDWEEEDDDEEDDGNSSSSINSDDIGAVYVDPESMEMQLPSGARVGHRSLSRYYKQHLHERNFAEEAQRRTRRWGVSAATSRAALSARQREPAAGVQGLGNNELRFAEGRKTRVAQQAEQAHQRFAMRIGQRHNHQKHYRDQLLQ